MPFRANSIHSIGSPANNQPAGLFLVSLLFLLMVCPHSPPGIEMMYPFLLLPLNPEPQGLID
ncbi:hypothetical protein P168DRAFT_290021 [Aspergillus campestris IBT 28561]|uniref:Uncharacterized protein n=1 Tax=Aspergillus campestris (strain IBT 28561) TaxID=1392248 RepID=A0A2I1D5T8_ASPC2|nr:uncharacterized protein P168DRAFT_290021 [Aspergillus campestris IBT 28561]PKY05228.1 hypothetical protein P168DRAFT_290021 [Aspergillus campestris IBT 28561]